MSQDINRKASIIISTPNLASGIVWQSGISCDGRIAYIQKSLRLINIREKKINQDKEGKLRVQSISLFYFIPFFSIRKKIRVPIEFQIGL